MFTSHGVSGFVSKKKDTRKRVRDRKKYYLDGSLVKVWDCCEETKRNGFNECCVRNVLKGRQPTHKGFIWRYAS
jgi:hypothetical protein